MTDPLNRRYCCYTPAGGSRPTFRKQSGKPQVTTDQITLFALLSLVFALLIWGRWRYDLVAFVALLTAILTGLVPSEEAFSGLGHPAVIIIALVLIVSKGLSNSGAIELLARYVVSGTRKLGMHITIMSSLAAGLSAVM